MKVIISYIVAIIAWITLSLYFLDKEMISFSAFYIILVILYMDTILIIASYRMSVNIITAVKSIINQLTNVKEEK